MSGRYIWFDLDNSPHPWILKDFIRQFEAAGFKTIITARDYSQTIPICEMFNLPYIKVGEAANSSSSLLKAKAVLTRALQLRSAVKKYNPVLAISHGSRSQALAGRLMGTFVVSLDDYEFSFKWFNTLVHKLYTPYCIPKDSWGIPANRVEHYPGLKEEVYLWNTADYADVELPFINPERVNILFRPAGEFAHYQSEKSFDLQNELVRKFADLTDCTVILSARSKPQEAKIKEIFTQLGVNFVIPGKVSNGPALIRGVDMIIGGGGTMTREASVLGTPSYSFFSGETGAVDKQLQAEGKLIMLNSVDDIEKITFTRKNPVHPVIPDSAFKFILNDLTRISGSL